MKIIRFSASAPAVQRPGKAKALANNRTSFWANGRTGDGNDGRTGGMQLGKENIEYVNSVSPESKRESRLDSRHENRKRVRDRTQLPNL